MGKPEVSEFDSVDPAPPSKVTSVEDLRDTLCNESERMFQRMRRCSPSGTSGARPGEAPLPRTSESPY